MDKERRKKIQTTKLVITEIFMLVIVVLTVIVLTFIVMGYHINEDGKLEQSGLLQIESVPTGASITIDGEALSSETNTNKILPEGTHTIELKKAGYTSWSKAVNLHSGFLTKLTYPRLYKEDPKIETVLDFDTSPSLFLASKDHSKGLLKYPSGKLEIISLESKTLKSTQLELSKILKNSTPSELENSQIIDWSKSGERIIVSSEKDGLTRFFIIDLEHPEYSLDLSAEFDIEISKLEFLNPQGDRLGILENHNFRTISLLDKKLSDVLVKNALFFSHNTTKVALTTKASDNTAEVILYDLGNKSSISLAKSASENIKAYLSEYAGRPTLVFIDDTRIVIRRGELPTENISKDNPLNEPVGDYTLSFGTAEDFSFKGENQLVVASKGSNLSVFDLENYQQSTFNVDASSVFWPDEYTVGGVVDGRLALYDFDGTNKVSFGSSENNFPAIITKDGNYLYYISNTNSRLSLVRSLIK